jgi:cell division protein FtsB
MSTHYRMTKDKIAEILKAKLDKLWGYVLWLMVVLLALSTARNIGKVVAIRTEIKKENDKVAKIKAENDKLKDEVASVQGPEFIEKEVRDKLGLARPGEAVVVLPDESTLRSLAPQGITEADALPDPIWKRWLKLFI